MAQDRLPESAFIRYLRYEHAFVRTALAVFAYALAKAPTPADQDHLLSVVNALAGQQQFYFQRAFASVGLGDEVLPNSALPRSARGLREDVLKIAESGGFEEILAAMLAAEWMYSTWCAEAHRLRPKRQIPADWISLHVEAAFQNQVEWLKRRLDDLGPKLDQAAQERCSENFGRILELEIAFHDAPYEDA
jgi:thiaminase/transcriptional activator TenA